MQPSNFQQTSDYLSLAQTEGADITWDVPQGATTNYVFYTSKTFTIARQSDTMLRFLINDSRYSTTEWAVGSYFAYDNNDMIYRIQVTMQSSTTLKISMEVISMGGATVTVPAHTIKVQVLLFKVPNLF